MKLVKIDRLRKGIEGSDRLKIRRIEKMENERYKYKRELI
jgi:hypothetical protein